MSAALPETRPAERAVFTSVLRRERAVTGAGVVLLCLFAWAYLFQQAAGMSGMADSGMSGMDTMRRWDPAALWYLWTMWSVMMVAMMLPSATPTILLFAALQRTRRRGREHGAHQDRTAASIPIFVLGYLLVWGGYSVLAGSVQWALHAAFLVSESMVSTSPLLSSALLIGAGVFQFTPLKDACVRHCQSPLAFLSSHWSEGALGALRMGFRHGIYCVGCCWALMALLFVLGVMNLLWITALAVLVLVEKTVPLRGWTSRAAGLLMIALGASVFAGAVGSAG